MRLVPSGRWDPKWLLAVHGIPRKLTMSDGSVNADIEVAIPHNNLEDAERDARDTEAADARAMDSSNSQGNSKPMQTALTFRRPSRFASKEKRCASVNTRAWRAPPAQ